jgi:hypothetical protein
MVKSTPFANSVVSALPAKENGKEVPVEAPRSASPPPPIPDDILNYQPLSATEKRIGTTPLEQRSALPPATAVHPLAPFLEAEREKREKARRRQQEAIEVQEAEQARKLNERDRFLAQKKAREIIMYAFLLFAGSRNASRKTKKSKKDKAYASV